MASERDLLSTPGGSGHIIAGQKITARVFSASWYQYVRKGHLSTLQISGCWEVSTVNTFAASKHASALQTKTMAVFAADTVGEMLFSALH